MLAILPTHRRPWKRLDNPVTPPAAPWWTGVMTSPASDEELRLRQSALQEEARAVLADLDLAAVAGDLGPVLLTGSYVSGLMCWRDLDAMLLVGGRFTPVDVLGLLRRLVERPGVTGFQYRDERGPRSPTGEVRDERYHIPVTVDRAGRPWRIDLSLWLHDPHLNVTRWHEELREIITAEQRRAVLRIKDVWHRRASYPDQISGFEIYTAVLEHGVRTPHEFAGWLAERGLPDT
jgi:hypothetical protein